MGGRGLALTSFIFKGSYNFSTVWALVISRLILVDAASTEYFPTAPVPMLLRVPGHTQANQTLEVIRGLLHKLVVIASRTGLRTRISSLDSRPHSSRPCEGGYIYRIRGHDWYKVLAVSTWFNFLMTSPHTV